jgi:hypothetical protein
MVRVVGVEFPRHKRSAMVKEMTMIAHVPLCQEWTAIPPALRRLI